MATKTKKEEIKSLEILPVQTEFVTVRIQGDSPLIMHAWSHKAKQEMLDKQMKKAAGPKTAKNPIQDFFESLYWLTNSPTDFTEDAFNEAIANGAKFGFPTTAIKQAAQSAAYRRGMIDNQMGLRGSFFIHGDDETDSFVEICYEEPPQMMESMVKIGMGTADIRYRGLFPKWYADLKIEYDKNGPYSLEQIINFLNVGGFSCGIGEWRPEKDGSYGRFHVAVNN